MPEQDKIWSLIARKLAGEANAEELAELDQLLRNRPDLQYSLQTIHEIWPQDKFSTPAMGKEAFDRHMRRMAILRPDLDLQDRDDSMSNSSLEKKPGTSKRKRRWLLAGGIVSALLVIALALYPLTGGMVKTIPRENNSPAINEVVTQYGSRSSIKLPDGSQVWLNAGTRLSYDKNYGENIREVSLTGEALFDVVKNPAKPFIIHTSSMDIKVLGTKFNVRSYPNDKNTEASLIRGSIEVSIRNRQSEKIILRPNEKIIVANEIADSSRRATPVGKKNNDIQNAEESLVAIRNLTRDNRSGAVMETSWVENKLVFRNESFAELAHRLERWYRVNISFRESGLTDLRFSGSFEDETIEQALHALRLTAAHAFNYTIQGNNITISGSIKQAP